MFLAGQASAEPKTSHPPVQAQATRRRAGWAWPAAFATMTAIAAALLVALAIRPAPQVVERIVEKVAMAPAVPQVPAAAIAEDPVEPDTRINSPAMAAALPGWLAWGIFPQPAVNTKQEPSYMELRNQVLSHGLNSWEPRASASAAAGRAEEEPVSSREQLKRWLEQEDVEGTSRRLSTPTLRNLSGARS